MWTVETCAGAGCFWLAAAVEGKQKQLWHPFYLASESSGSLAAECRVHTASAHHSSKHLYGGVEQYEVREPARQKCNENFSLHPSKTIKFSDGF